MSAGGHEGLVRRLVEDVINQDRLDLADQVIDPSFVEHELLPIEEKGLDAFKPFCTLMRRAFPDFQFTVEDTIAEGDKVVCRMSIQGTHRGEFMGIPPTGKRINLGAIDILRIANGRIVEHWGQSDMLGLMQKLGAVPPPGQPTR